MSDLNEAIHEACAQADGESLLCGRWPSVVYRAGDPGDRCWIGQFQHLPGVVVQEETFQAATEALVHVEERLKRAILATLTNLDDAAHQQALAAAVAAAQSEAFEEAAQIAHDHRVIWAAGDGQDVALDIAEAIRFHAINRARAEGK